MTTNGKVVVNLATGLEDPERVTVAFRPSSATDSAARGKRRGGGRRPGSGDTSVSMNFTRRG
jgi:hypothetical protein